MQYNGSPTKQDIVTLSEKLCKASSTSFPIEDKTFYANQALKMIWSWIHDAYGGWLYDDNNYDTYPEATTTLTTNQVDYTLPSNDLTIRAVSVLTVGNVWQPLIPITLEQINDRGFSESQFFSVSSQPLYYRPLAKGFKIYPAANYTQAASLKVFYDREVSQFLTTDTTKTPGFDSQYHEAVPTFMALQYAKINSLSVAGGVMRGGFKTGLLADWSEYEQQIKQDYSKRFAELFPARVTVRDAVRDAQ